MAEESLTLPCDTNDTIDYHIVTLFEKINELRRDKKYGIFGLFESKNNRQPMQVEIRSLEFWRSIISECMASFFYVFIVCGAAAGAGVGASLSSVLLATALAAGFAMTTLTHCFAHISGAHVNPAVTLAMAVTRNVSPIRATLFLLGQCGGGIAGAAVLYGVTVPGYTGNLAAAVAQTAHLATWERFGVEFLLTFIVVFTYFVSMDSYHRYLNSSALTIGAAYTTCTFVSMPYLNPARSLGPSFILNKWDNHWVYWFGPMVGGVMSGLIYEFIFNPRRYNRCSKESIDGDNSSIHSDEENYDDLDKGNGQKFHGSNYNTYRSAITGTLPGINTGASNYCNSLASASIYSTNQSKLNRVESLYGGTKSLYCKSPPLTRANLNRSQSVYTKSNCNVNLLPRPGPLVPAQSLYPMRLNQQSTHVQNQNVHNQMQQCSEGIYGMRGGTNSNRSESNYGQTSNASTNSRTNENQTYTGTNPRNDSNYNGRQEASYNANANNSNRSDSGYATSTNSNNRNESQPTFNSNGNNQNRSETYNNNNSSNRSESAYGTVPSSASSNRSEPVYHSNASNRSESDYGQTTPSNNYPVPQNTIYSINSNADDKKCNNAPPPPRGTRPESMYGLLVNQNGRRGNLTPEDTYNGPNTNRPGQSNTNYINSVISYKAVHGNSNANGGNGQTTQSNSAATFTPNTSAPVYHHQRPQHSPSNSQY